MRLDELFTNLGVIAGTIAAQVRETTVPGVAADELDLTGPAPRKIAVTGAAQVVIIDGDEFRVEVEPGPESDSVRFALEGKRLAIGGGGPETVVRLALPTPRKLTIAGSGSIRAVTLAPHGKVSVAGSGRVELAQAHGEALKVSIAGSGRAMVDGRVDKLELSIAGSGSFDGEGLAVTNAKISMTGSGVAIVRCDGDVSASLMGSGDVIVRGSARCQVSSLGSGTVVCERPPQAA